MIFVDIIIHCLGSLVVSLIYHLRATSSHVDNTGSSKIDHTNVTECIFSEGSQEPISTPDRADDNWVNLCLFLNEKLTMLSESSVHMKTSQNTSFPITLTNAVRKRE